MIRSYRPTPAILLALAACAEPPAPGPALPTAEAGCDAERVAGELGRAFDPARIGEVQAEAGASLVRVIRAGELYTQDYAPERLNIQLDEDGRIERLWCG